ncbi:hypothetical protein GCM10020001_047360 [Nonomuraea salmonea]
MAFVRAFNVASSGRMTVVKALNGRVRIRAARSGWVSAQLFGAISPTTMCRNVTRARAKVRAIGRRIASGMPTAAKTGSK